MARLPEDNFRFKTGFLKQAAYAGGSLVVPAAGEVSVMVKTKK